MGKEDENLLRQPPLYRQAADLIRKRLSGMAVGDSLPSERLLAEQYGISITTVREAVRILAAEGRVERRQGKGTFIARASSRGDVAILIERDIADPRMSPAYVRIAQEARHLLARAGVSSRLYIGRTPHGEESSDFLCPEFFEDLGAGRICGAIGVLLSGGAEWLNRLPATGIRMVGFGHDKPCGVCEDTRAFLTEAVRELVQRGRKKIGLLTWCGFESWRPDNSGMFQEILQDAGVSVVPQWIKDDLYMVLSGAGWASFREIWSALPQRPDGLVIADDFFLGGALAAAGEMGLRIPEQLDIAVRTAHHVGSHYSAPLLIWESDTASIATALVEAELTILSGKTPEPPFTLIPPRRVIEPAVRPSAITP